MKIFTRSHLLLTAAVAMILALASCGGQETTAPDTAEAKTDAVSIDAVSTDADETEPTELSEEMALQIASEYWNVRPGDKDPHNGYQYGLFVMNGNGRSDVHVIMLKWLVEEHHYSTVDEIWVHKRTGEIILPTWDGEADTRSEGK